MKKELFSTTSFLHASLKQLIHIFTLGYLLAASTVLGQNVGINATGALPDNSAGLDINYADKGLLIPRVALLATNNPLPVATPATSLLVYNTATSGSSPYNVVPGFYYWTGSSWATLGSSTPNNWTLLGNAGTISGVNFLGTTDNVPLEIRTANTLRTRITLKGQIETLNTGQSVFVGERSGDNDDASNNQNIFVGFETGMSNITGMNNIGLGYQSLFSNTGNRNIGIGFEAMRSNTGGFENVAVGHKALHENLNGSNNVAAGAYALHDNVSGTGNIAVGDLALESNTSGNRNAAIGSNALINNSSGSSNVAFGAFSLGALNSGNYNTALGYQAGASALGSGNVFLGYQAGFSESGSNKLYIANNNTLNPLIYGDFSTGRVGIGTTSSNPQATLDVSGTFKLGTNGTVLNSMIRSTLTMDIPSIPANSTYVWTTGMASVNANASVSVSPSATLGAGMISIEYVRASAANTIEITFRNNSGVAIDLPSMNYYVLCIQ